MSIVWQTKRKAVAMIELIFAIVIMGIAVMSAPMLISQASMGGIAVTQQEAIVSGATQIGMIMTRHWDEADTNDSDFSPILVVDEDKDALNEKDDSGKRVGIPPATSRSFISSSGERLHVTSIANEEGDAYDDIDDFNGSVVSLSNEQTASAEDGDYIDNSLQMSTSVEYLKTDTTDDTFTSEQVNYNTPFAKTAPAGTTTNIKAITTRVTSQAHDDVLHTDITLRAFMCNIGTYKLKTRSF